MATNLPPKPINDSAAGTRLYFDTYGETPLQFNSSDVDFTIAFFTGYGFDKDAATTSAITLLKQAKLDGVSIGSILDRMRGFNQIQISNLVSQILNNNRVATSTLGYRTQPVDDFKTRNISA